MYKGTEVSLEVMPIQLGDMAQELGDHCFLFFPMQDYD